MKQDIRYPSPPLQKLLLVLVAISAKMLLFGSGLIELAAYGKREFFKK